jgi:thiol-disulfide isomerase/thioredoxin
MDRRLFLTASAAIALTPVATLANFVDYTPGLIDKELKAGKTVFVDFAADWCSTCARQERVIKALQASNPAYEKAMTFVRVDWDDYKNDPFTKSKGIPRRSTLLVLRGTDELGRIVAGTSETQIKALMDLGLAQS